MKHQQNPLKQELTNKLIAAKAFWSYAVTADTVIPDEVLIEKMKTYTLEELTDKYIGKSGTKPRNKFDNELRRACRTKTAKAK
jgi:hypothetical protein